MSHQPMPEGGPIVAAQKWRDNAAMIGTARDLGYIGDRVLDPTYGRGNWWKAWRPVELVTHDIRNDGVDFRALPDEGLFDTVAFDPPYIPQGGRTTSTLSGSFLDSYGLWDVPTTNDELRTLIRDGIKSFSTVLNPRGTLLVKCMSYVNGGQLRPMPRWIANDAEDVGFVQIDELVHLRHPGPQPPRLTQRTARRNYSMLLIFRWPAVKPARALKPSFTFSAPPAVGVEDVCAVSPSPGPPPDEDGETETRPEVTT